MDLHKNVSWLQFHFGKCKKFLMKNLNAFLVVALIFFLLPAIKRKYQILRFADTLSSTIARHAMPHSPMQKYISIFPTNNAWEQRHATTMPC
jgi:hypothetical protein